MFDRVGRVLGAAEGCRAQHLRSTPTRGPATDCLTNHAAALEVASRRDLVLLSAKQADEGNDAGERPGSFEKDESIPTGIRQGRPDPLATSGFAPYLSDDLSKARSG